MKRLKQMMIFAAIVEARSISAAGEQLSLSKSVISQNLKDLEHALGVILLKRTTRKLSLTDAGNRFYLQCKEINLIASNAWEQAQTFLNEPKGRVRITAPNALMETLVTPVIAELIKRYPDMKPELVNADEQLDFMEHDIDLAIRVGRSSDSSLTQKRIGSFKDVLCGMPEFAGQQLGSLPYIANVWQGKKISHTFVKENKEVQQFSTEAQCITNSFYSCISLLKAGAGIGVVPDFYLSKFADELVAVNSELILPSNPVFAMHPYGKNQPLNVRVCTEAITEQLTKLVAQSTH